MEHQPSAIETQTYQRTFYSFLFEPVDNSSLIIFRIFFGLLLALEGGGAIATGWVKRVFVETTYTFTFIGFEWLHPLLGETMYAVYIILCLCGMMVMLGWYYRFSMTLFSLLWTMTYLMQKSSYNNHYYLLMLICWIMVIMPAHHYKSLDVRFGRVTQRLTCPRWCLLFFVMQVSLVYIFAALAKIYPDWLALLPINIWFDDKADYFAIGALLQKEWFRQMVAYGGIAFDLLIAPLLLWKITRKYAFIVAIIFHLFNSIIFGIGIFPYLMILFCVFFFPPATIRQIFFKAKPLTESRYSRESAFNTKNKIVFGIFLIYFIFQLFLPLRHLWYKGDVFWTEEGHRMSWRMMLRAKSGTIYFKVKDADTGAILDINPRQFLTRKQISKMATQPDMIWQFSQFLKNYYQTQNKKTEIYAFSKVSLNGKQPQWLIDTTTNLAQVRWQPFQHAAWILPEN